MPTCAGCGAMGRPGTCETGCAEVKLELARAETVDALERARGCILAYVAALRLPIEALTTRPKVPEEGWEAAYAALREQARAALAYTLDADTAAFVREQPAEPVIAWACDRCDGIEATQPCLGICVWRRVDWIRYDIYTELRAQVIAELELYTRLRSLVWRVAHTTPHRGQDARAWTSYGPEAAALLPSSGREPARSGERRP